ncbi:SID1 transmembrane family member 1-like isoform X1 [Haliotis cracherodii]|uniref:SID1 transmembrane family member 1-like isoform X1 n=1 Tax=Haliotis cracherodii TaxID=6455 RepID=UPI0039EC6807
MVGSVFGVLSLIFISGIASQGRKANGHLDEDTDYGRVGSVVSPHGDLQNDFQTHVVDAEFGTTYKEIVDLKSQILFVYNFNVTEGLNQTTAVRVSVSSINSTSSSPVMVVVRQRQGIMSWAVPLFIDYIYAYSSVSRTLCPIFHLSGSDTEEDPQQQIFVEVSSMAVNATPFTFSAERLPDFELRHSEMKNTTVSPSEPQYFLYKFPEKVTSVLIKVKSDSITCMVVSIQDVRCPVYDLDRNVEFAGKYQTMSTQAAMLLQASDYEHKQFYVVLIVKPLDLDCLGIEQIQTAGASTARGKNVTILVEDTIPKSQYYKGIFAAVGFFSIFYVIAGAMLCCFHRCGTSKSLMEISDSERDKLTGFIQPGYHTTNQNAGTPSDIDSSQSFVQSGASYGSMSSSLAKELEPVVPGSATPPQTPPGHHRADSLDESDVDFLHDANEEKDIFRTKTALFVSDLARKSRKKLSKLYKIYHWNLFTIAIFYGLPVAQLVITYQNVLVATGNEDLCYYNFDCAHPLGVLSCFNNVFSNIGYVLLGILFILLVWRRDSLHKRLVREHGDVEQRFGIPQHFGLFYAMGVALVMEGVMSACYHVCPNYSNFQFDTSFMYIIACLCMLKIYQSRHPDINAKAYQAYLCMALVIFMAVIGVVYATGLFWIMYAIVHMLVSLLLSAQIYYMGRWQIDRYIFKRLWYVFVTDCLKCARPTYRDRFTLLLIGNTINWSFAIYGAIKQPADFASYLLAIFIGNLLLYCLFYILMKLLTGEKIKMVAIFIILLSMVTWGSALYFFFSHLTSWHKTPAGSRESNRDCILLEFYDAHDVWHFMSAVSLFLSFLILLLLDDDLSLKRRDRIPVF